MLVSLDRGTLGQHVFELAFPAVAALICGQPVGHGAVGHLLQIDVQRRLHAQPGLMHLLGAKSLFQFAAHLLLKPRRNRLLRLRDVQAQRRIAGLLGARCEITPSDSISLSTRLRRRSALSGLSSGE